MNHNFLNFNQVRMVLPKDWPIDITKQDIQNYLLKYYSSTNAPKHQPLFGHGNRCVQPIPVDVDGILSFPQSVVQSIMKGIAQTPNTPNRGLLVWGSVGSGKTLTATAVMDAFWDTKKNIVFATSVEASNSNPPATFYNYARKYITRFQGKSIESVEKEFKQRKVAFHTFATLSHYLLIANPLKRVKTDDDKEKHKSFLKDAILIIDEVHNIFKPLPNQKLENDALKKFLIDIDNQYTSGMKIVILTATPGDTPDAVVQLLNMVRDKENPPIIVPNISNQLELNKFAESIRGLVSFYDASRDYTRFPRVQNSTPTRSPMSMKQYVRYAEAYKDEPETNKNTNKSINSNRYYKHSRKYSNMLYDLDKDMMIQEFSTKLVTLVDTIKKYPHEKHYIYSSFYENRGYGGHGILAIAKTLEQQLGFEKVDISVASKMVKSIKNQSKQPRYVLAIPTDLSENRNSLRTLTSVFNLDVNARGDFIQLFLASGKYNEGIDLRDVRHVHIFEPLLTFAADKQTIGRAARFCSHSDLNRDKGEWTVKVHRYISDHPETMSMFNLNYLRDRTEFFVLELESLQTRYEEIRKQPEYKQVVEELQKQMKEYQVMIKQLEKSKKEIEKMNLHNVAMIDDKITQEALQRTHDMMIIYNIMKTEAVDYLLFKEFHSSQVY